MLFVRPLHSGRRLWKRLFNIRARRQQPGVMDLRHLHVVPEPVGDLEDRHASRRQKEGSERAESFIPSDLPVPRGSGGPDTTDAIAVRLPRR